MKNTLENLELKLAQTRLENSEKLDMYEAEYKKEYLDFLGNFLDNDNLGIKRIISVTFQLEKLENPLKSSSDIFKIAVKKSIEDLPINTEKKDIFLNNILKLNNNKEKIENLFIKNSNLNKNENYPILESLEKNGILDQNDIIKISLKFKEVSNFLDSILILEEGKKDIIKTHYYELNNTKSLDRISNFESDFKEDIDNSSNIMIYPRVLSFIGKNYFKLRIKNKIESKADRLRRIFKIAFLKLYRLKYSGLDINSIINKIDSLDDLDSMINLLLKFFNQLKENPNLAKDYIVSDEVDDISEIHIEAEENKEKILFGEENIIKASNLIESGEKEITSEELEELLSENVDLIGDNFIKRNINTGILVDTNLGDNIEDDKEEDSKEVDLDEYYDVLKLELDKIEKKKIKVFLEGNYDLLDEINDELLTLIVKLEKVSKLLGNTEENI